MTGRAMAARSGETGTGSTEGNSAVANGDGPQTTDNREIPVTTSEQQAVPVAQVDWRLIAKAAGEHGVRYRTNTALLAFLDEIEPARKADRFDPALPCKSGEGADHVPDVGKLVRELGPPCENCQKPVEVGQLVICYDDVGEMHADCENPFSLEYDPPKDSAPEPVILLGSPMRHVPLALLPTPSEQFAKSSPDAETNRTAADLLEQYAGFIRSDVKADHLERHPYLPLIEQTVEDLRATSSPDAAGSDLATENAAYLSDVRWWLEIAQGKGYDSITAALEASPDAAGSGGETREWFPHLCWAGEPMHEGQFREPWPMQEELESAAVEAFDDARTRLEMQNRCVDQDTYAIAINALIAALTPDPLADAGKPIDATQTREAELESALEDLVSWFPESGPSQYGPWIIKAGEHGADDAIATARAALNGRDGA